MSRHKLQQWMRVGVVLALVVDGVTAGTPGMPVEWVGAAIAHACICLAFLVWTRSTDQ